MQLLACAFYVNMNIPFMIRYLGGQYTGDDRNIEKTLNNLKGNIPPLLLKDIERILRIGCPTYLSGDINRKQFLEHWRYGNNRSIYDNEKNLTKVLNKEDKHKYLFVLPLWLVRFIPNLYLSPQGLIKKENKEDR